MIDNTVLILQKKKQEIRYLTNDKQLVISKILEALPCHQLIFNSSTSVMSHTSKKALKIYQFAQKKICLMILGTNFLLLRSELGEKPSFFLLPKTVIYFIAPGDYAGQVDSPVRHGLDTWSLTSQFFFQSDKLLANT